MWNEGLVRARSRELADAPVGSSASKARPRELQFAAPALDQMSETVWIAGDGRSNYPYARAAVVAREPGEDGAVTVQPADGSPAVAIPAAAAHRANPLGQRADNCELLYLNEACVLANIAERYEQKAIYTWTSRVLVSVNPYEELKIYGERELGSTPGLGLRELPPHVYSVAEAAYRGLLRARTNQAVIVSGESGAGKTYNMAQVIAYLVRRIGGAAGSTDGASHQLTALMVQATPVLEAQVEVGRAYAHAPADKIS